ncbi:hypothetical protein CQJ94_16170 [Glycomyces fuscus]|nr:hypothetical protein CQJ94_16170 [Glycomyces fuscus]
MAGKAVERAYRYRPYPTDEQAAEFSHTFGRVCPIRDRAPRRTHRRPAHRTTDGGEAGGPRGDPWRGPGHRRVVPEPPAPRQGRGPCPRPGRAPSDVRKGVPAGEVPTRG